MLNLLILTIGTYYTYLFEGNQLIVGYTWTTSVSIALATFIGILTYHILVLQLANVTGITQYLKRKCAALKVSIMVPSEAERSPTDFLPNRLINPADELSFHTQQLRMHHC